MVFLMVFAFACWLLAAGLWMSALNEKSRLMVTERARRQRVEDIWG